MLAKYYRIRSGTNCLQEIVKVIFQSNCYHCSNTNQTNSNFNQLLIIKLEDYTNKNYKISLNVCPNPFTQTNATA